MGLYTIKLPDVGEGIAEAELGVWHVAIGDIVKEDDILTEMMTEKAAVEIPSSVSGNCRTAATRTRFKTVQANIAL